MNTEKIIKNVVFYTRVSSKEQIQNFSLENQELEIREFCKKENYNIIEKFTDEGITGTSVSERLGLKKMLNRIINDATIDAVVIWKLSRISRNTRDLLDILDILKRDNKKSKNQCTLISIKDNINTASQTSKMLIYFLGIFSEMERENIVTQVILGMKGRAKEGLTNGGPIPFGYKRDINKRLVIVEEQAKVIQKIFTLYNKKMGYEAISKILYKDNIKTNHGKKFDKQAIKYILENPIYVGKVRWGKKGDEEEIFVNGQHKAIIDKDLWELTQKRKQESSFKPIRKHNFNFLLTGLIKCPSCGSPLIGYPNGKHKYYACSRWNSNKSECNSNLLRGDLIEKDLIEKLHIFIKDKKITEAVEEQYKNKNKNIEILQKEKQALEKDLENIKKRVRIATEMRLDEEITKIEYSEIKSNLCRKEEKIISNITNITNDLKKIESQQVTKKQIDFYFNNFATLFNKSVAIKEKNELLHAIIKEIHVNTNKDIKKRNINKIVFSFNLNNNKDWVTYDTVHYSLS